MGYTQIGEEIDSDFPLILETVFGVKTTDEPFDISPSDLHFFSRTFGVPAVLVRTSDYYNLYLGEVKDRVSKGKRPLVYDPVFDETYSLIDDKFVAYALGDYADVLRDSEDESDGYVVLTNLENLSSKLGLKAPKLSPPIIFENRTPTEYHKCVSGLYALAVANKLKGKGFGTSRDISK